MELKLQATTVEASAKFEKGIFGIGNVALVMEILRSKMYSVPIRTIVQEIASNARDAHREVGTPNVPIEIKLPNSLDKTFHVRDFGPGITPDRMTNIFLQYGNSTKRSDNTQTGGFGLGAKSPFAYVDQFCIESITTENGKRIKRSYTATIDASRMGELSCMLEEETNDPQGTKIIVACKPHDEFQFEKWVGNVCRFWDVKPTIKGSASFRFPELKYHVQGNGWKLGGQDGESDPIAVVDGIPYTIRSNSLGLDSSSMSKGDANLLNVLRHPIRLFFNVGELTLTANREEIDYQPETITRIKARLKTFVQEYGKEYEKIIAKAKNLFEASQIWGQTPHDQRELLKGFTPQWQGVPVRSEYQLTNATIYHFYRDTTTRYVNNVPVTTEFVRQQRSDRGTLNFDRSWRNEKAFEKDIVCFDDTGHAQPSKARAITLLQDKKVENVYVIHWSVENDDKEMTKSKAAREAAFKQLHLDKMELVAYSTVQKTKIEDPSRKGSSNGPAARVKVFHPGQLSGFSSDWDASWNDTDKTTADKGVYVTLLGRCAHMDKECKREIRIEQLTKLVPLVGQIHGIFQRYTPKLSDGWKSLSEVLTEKLNAVLQDSDALLAVGCAMVQKENAVNTLPSHYVPDESRILDLHKPLRVVLGEVAPKTQNADIKRLAELTELGLKSAKLAAQFEVAAKNVLFASGLKENAIAKAQRAGDELRHLMALLKKEYSLLNAVALTQASGFTPETVEDLILYVDHKGRELKKRPKAKAA